MSIVVVLSACADPQFFLCNEDSECGEGHCEENGFCSFDDDTCASGRRYGELAAGGLAGMCVDEGGGTMGSTSTSDTTSSTTTPATTMPPGTSTTAGLDDSTSTDTGGSTGAVQWWDTQWGWRRTLTVTTDAQQTEPLSGFPLLLALTPRRIDYAETAADGADIRIVPPGSADPLPHEIDEWNEDETSWVWVRLPEYPAGPAELTLHLYYGNPGATDGESPTVVWSDYTAVWHMREDGADASATDAALTLMGTAASPGPVGDGLRFDPALTSSANAGSNVAFDGLFASGATVSFWMHADGYGDNGFGRIFDRSMNTASLDGFHIRVSQGQPDGLNFDHWTVSDTDWEFDLAQPAITLSAWHYVTIAYVGGMEPPVVFADGASQASQVPGAAPPDGTLVDGAGLDLWIGNRDNQNRTFDGVLDEVRIYPGLLSEDWHRAQYNAMQDALVSYGDAEAAP